MREQWKHIRRVELSAVLLKPHLARLTDQVLDEPVVARGVGVQATHQEALAPNAPTSYVGAAHHSAAWRGFGGSRAAEAARRGGVRDAGDRQAAYATLATGCGRRSGRRVRRSATRSAPDVAQIVTPAARRRAAPAMGRGLRRREAFLRGWTARRTARATAPLNPLVSRFDTYLHRCETLFWGSPDVARPRRSVIATLQRFSVG